MLEVRLSVYFLEQTLGRNAITLISVSLIYDNCNETVFHLGTKFFVVCVSTKQTNSFVQEVPVEGNDLQCTFHSNGYGSAMANVSGADISKTTSTTGEYRAELIWKCFQACCTNLHHYT
ncbi:hypothetical protein ACS0TY_005133 [Phlomoides rotata]